jgi:signal transduction histidine kinase
MSSIIEDNAARQPGQRRRGNLLSGGNPMPGLRGSTTVAHITGNVVTLSGDATPGCPTHAFAHRSPFDPGAVVSLASRLRHLGLQRRIMLYVTLGLASMFGTLAFLGLGAIDEATRLVFQERLSTAYTTAGIIERDLGRIPTDVRETSRELSAAKGSGSPALGAAELLEHFTRVDPYPFFRISGIWLLDPSGDIVDAAGLPAPADAPPGAGRSLVATQGDQSVVFPSIAPVRAAIAFATVLVRMSGTPASVVLVHTMSVNSSADFVPALYGRAGGSPPTAPGVDAAETYHLEVVDPDGTAILGIGSDEVPGQQSRHFSAIRELMASGTAAALLHEPEPGMDVEPHVMAVVPLAGSPFYVVLEQPVDVALALPHRLREQLLLATLAGFLASLLVAWITTRHVVKPTEELTGAAERMAGGDLASPIRVAAQDEIGQLAESLEAMRQRLGAAHEAVEKTNKELEVRVAERTERLGQVLRQTISAQEDERRRLARELHDETAQTIAALSIALDRARDGLGAADPEAISQIGQAKQLSSRLLAETRRLILGLRPTVLDDMGLLPAIRWYAESYLAERGIEVKMEAALPAQRLPAHIEVALFRIVQEALANVAKHAHAGHVDVRLTHDEREITVTVADDGTGFDVAHALGRPGPTESVGLLGMQERARLLGGRLEIRSREGGGTVVRVEVPMSDEAG